MPGHANQKMKLLHLQKLLFTRTDEEHFLTMDEILAALEKEGIHAERKSIYRDLQTLQDFGIDIRQKKGRQGGYYLATRDFEIAELKLLVDAVQSSRFITHRKSSELIHKVEGLTSQPQASRLQRQVYVLGRVKTINEGIYRNIDVLHEAISAGKQIKFHYFQWQVDFSSHHHFAKSFRHGGLFYQVSPWALMWDHENYYLVAYDQEFSRTKHYRVDKIEDLEILNVPREGKRVFENFNVAEYARKTFGMFHGDEQWVRMKCENRFLGVLYDHFGDELSVAPCDERHFFAAAKVAVSPQFFAWVFGLSGAVQITDPLEVVQSFQEMLKKFFPRAEKN